MGALPAYLVSVFLPYLTQILNLPEVGRVLLIKSSGFHLRQIHTS